MPQTLTAIQGWNARHFRNTERYAAMIDRLYQLTVEQVVAACASVSGNEDKPFTFRQYPVLNRQVGEFLVEMAANMKTVTEAGQRSEWLFAAQKNDELVASILDTTRVPAASIERYMNRNLEGLASFQRRKKGGLSLSERIWTNTQQMKQELELALDTGLGEGKSAAELSRSVRNLLNEPDRLFRRVRDKRGVLHLSKNAKAYSPGRGRYRSSYKNAMRLTRTEVNMAYRESDHQRFQQLDFVVGYEVKRSNNPYECPVCGPLAGKYPKTFKFRGWHPQCRCYVVSILATREEMDKFNEDLIDGIERPKISSVNAVDDLPSGYKDWVQKNEQRLLAAPTSGPFFIRDNYQDGDFRKGLKPDIVRVKAGEVKKAERGNYDTDELELFLDSLDSEYRDLYDQITDGDVDVEGYKEFMEHITPEEFVAIREYSGPKYTELNEYLRKVRGRYTEHSDEELDARVKVINSALNRLPKHEGTVFRGTTLSQDYINSKILDRKGSFFKDHAFLSTSKDINIAMDFSEIGNGRPVIFEIQSKTGVAISNISELGWQDEVLFRTDNVFKIIDVIKEDDIYRVILEDKKYQIR